MRILAGTMVWVVLGHPVYAQEAEYLAACEKVAAAKGEPASFIPLCTCAYGVIDAELGAAFTKSYMRWETGAASLAEVLPDGMTEDAFFAAVGGIPEEKWATCAQ